MPKPDKGALSADVFFSQAMHPHQPDEFATQINRPPGDRDPNTTFSQEAVDAISEQFRTWVMARIVAHKERTGRYPKNMRATINLDWAPQHPYEDAGLYYHIAEDTGIEPIDGSVRKWAWSAD